jgi:8-oxo-dGTP diphosphatase
MAEQEPIKEIVRVVGAVIVSERRDKVLLGQRSESQSHPLKWEFIGGKIEPGESPEEALIREVDEETGLKIEVGRFLDVVEADYRNYGRPSHQISFYECRRINGVAKLDPEIYNEVRWVRLDEIAELDWIDGNKGFAKRLAIHLTSPGFAVN